MAGLGCLEKVGAYQWLDESSPKPKSRHPSGETKSALLVLRKPMSKNTRDMLISLLALAVIVFGIRYHLMRERLRHADLHSWYQQENATNFGGSLQDADVEWGDLREEKAEGITYRYTDDSFAIVIDRHSNTSESQARETLRHEICHVATWGDEHGPKWQACISRRID